VTFKPSKLSNIDEDKHKRT